MLTKEQLAKLIDHTLLKPNATKNNVTSLCKEARRHGFWSICVNPTYVSMAARMLKGTGVKICTVIGFPLGANTPEVKAFEAKNAIDNGASEIDMVINIGALKSGDYELVKQDIKRVVEKKGKKNIVVKVIIETGLLTEEEKVLACRISKEAGADFVKTSTGFSVGGATIHDVKLMRKTVGPNFGVKASGGIRNYQDAMELINAGANRIGTSSGVAIIEGYK